MPYWSTLYLASEWAIRLIMLVYVPQRRTAAATRTWLLLIFLLPWPGWVIYALRRIRVPRQRIKQQRIASQRIVQAQLQENRYPVCELRASLLPRAHPRTAARLGDFGAFAGNAVELLPEYEASITRLVADIDAATHHDHLLTYILAADATGRRVASAMVSAARRGVQCRADGRCRRPRATGSISWARSCGRKEWKSWPCSKSVSSATTPRASI